MGGKEEKTDLGQSSDKEQSGFSSTTQDKSGPGPNSIANMEQRQAGGNFNQLKQQFLPFPGEPPLKWHIWFQMFQDHLICQGLEHSSDARKLAFLRSNLGKEV